jgi:hypothetical protein
VIASSLEGRIPRLVLVAPDIAEAPLSGRSDHALMQKRLEQPLPMSWEEQGPRLLSTFTPEARGAR